MSGSAWEAQARGQADKPRVFRVPYSMTLPAGLSSYTGRDLTMEEAEEALSRADEYLDIFTADLKRLSGKGDPLNRSFARKTRRKIDDLDDFVTALHSELYPALIGGNYGGPSAYVGVNPASVNITRCSNCQESFHVRDEIRGLCLMCQSCWSSPARHDELLARRERGR